MTRGFKFLTMAGAAMMVASPALAQSLDLGIGVRETETDAAIGADGGFSGGIEFVDRDVHSVTLDNTWQLVTIDLDTAAITAFAGATADGVLDGGTDGKGVLEHINIRSGGFTGPITLWIDDVTFNDGAANFVLADFEANAIGDEVMFQEPRFSGSTAGSLTEDFNVSAVTDAMAQSGSQSLEVQFEFIDDDPTRWVRLTTFQAANVPNPTIGTSGTLSFYVKGVPEPASLALLGLGGLAALARRRTA